MTLPEPAVDFILSHYIEPLLAVMPVPETRESTQSAVKEAFEKGWHVIVWNDPVNLMSYVVHVFRKVLGFDPETARRHMLEVHQQGKSCVARETREKCEFYCRQLQEHGLKTTIEKAS